MKCYHVKLKSLDSISNKCYLAKCYDGSEDYIPKSQVFGFEKRGWWISEWILERKNIQYSRKKQGWFDVKKQTIRPFVHIIKHVPGKIEFEKNIVHEDLHR